MRTSLFLITIFGLLSSFEKAKALDQTSAKIQLNEADSKMLYDEFKRIDITESRTEELHGRQIQIFTYKKIINSSDKIIQMICQAENFNGMIQKHNCHFTFDLEKSSDLGNKIDQSYLPMHYIQGELNYKPDAQNIFDRILNRLGSFNTLETVQLIRNDGSFFAEVQRLNITCQYVQDYPLRNPTACQITGVINQ